MNKEDLEQLLKNLPIEVPQGVLTGRELRSRLVVLLQAVHDSLLPGQELVSIFLDLLSKNLPQGLGDVLQIALMELSFDVQDERIVYYWRSLVNSKDQFQRNSAINELFRLTEKSQLASAMLREYLGEEPTEEIRKRLLFPSGFGNETEES